MGRAVTLIPYCVLKGPQQQYKWDSIVLTLRSSDYVGLKQNLGNLANLYSQAFQLILLTVVRRLHLEECCQSAESPACLHQRLGSDLYWCNPSSKKANCLSGSWSCLLPCLIMGKIYWESEVSDLRVNGSGQRKGTGSLLCGESRNCDPPWPPPSQVQPVGPLKKGCRGCGMGFFNEIPSFPEAWGYIRQQTFSGYR